MQGTLMKSCFTSKYFCEFGIETRFYIATRDSLVAVSLHSKPNLKKYEVPVELDSQDVDLTASSATLIVQKSANTPHFTPKHYHLDTTEHNNIEY